MAKRKSRNLPRSREERNTLPKRNTSYSKLAIILVVIFALYASLYSNKDVKKSAEPAETGIERPGIPVEGQVQMKAGPPVDGRDDIVSTLPAGNASHSLHTVYFGTDRTPATPFGGVSSGTFTIAIVALLLALLSSLTWNIQLRIIPVGSLIGCVILLIWFAIRFIPIKFNPKAAYAYTEGRDQLSLGVCTVSVPYNHKKGSIEGPSITKFEFREDPEKHIVLQSVNTMSQQEFAKELHAAATDAPWKEALVYIHGYNTTFEDAAKRAGQLACDLEFGGTTAFFSWPSNGSSATYPWDASSADFAADDLKRFLGILVKEGNLKRIHIIAHSMGNRCFAKAISGGLMLGDCQLDNCILAAADVDAADFKKDYAPKIISSSNLTTLYASSNDRALLASEGMNRYPRAGDISQPVFISGIETIDATDLKTDFLGHSYYGSSPVLISDLKQIIGGRLHAAKRQGMQELPATGSLKYWKFQDSASATP
jgi:esterase/lipase superfamily enzyme